MYQAHHLYMCTVLRHLRINDRVLTLPYGESSMITLISILQTYVPVSALLEWPLNLEFDSTECAFPMPVVVVSDPISVSDSSESIDLTGHDLIIPCGIHDHEFCDFEMVPQSGEESPDTIPEAGVSTPGSSSAEAPPEPNEATSTYTVTTPYVVAGMSSGMSSRLLPSNFNSFSNDRSFVRMTSKPTRTSLHKQK